MNVTLNQKCVTWLMVTILLLGSALRMVALEQSPPGFSLDEACESYDAYSLWHTGRDQHGVFLPIAIRAFNDYRMPLFIYSMAPVVGIAGLSVMTARLTAVFWSILAIAATYWVGAQMFGRIAGLVAALLLAISPWHVPLSRMAHESNTVVLTTALVVGMLWRWRRTSQKQWIIGAAIISGLGIYTYSVMTLFLPLIIILSSLFFLRTMLAHRHHVLIAAGVGALLAFPMVCNVLRYPDEMQSRYRQIAALRPEQSLSEACIETLHNARRDLSPSFLFGSDNLNKHPENIEKLYPAQALLILAGVIWSIKQRENLVPLMITTLWILAGVLPAVLTTETNHELRALPMIIPWQLLSGLGMVGLLNFTRARSIRFTVPITILFWVGVNAFGYFEYYFLEYSTAIPHHLFDVGMAEIVTEMDRLDDEYEVVYFNCYATTFPYIDILFFTRYDPHLLQTDLPDWEQDSVRRVGKYYIVCDTETMWSSGLPGLFVVPADELPDEPPLAVTTYANGNPRFKIVGRSESFIDALGWLSQCDQPVAPLDKDLIARAVGRDDLRQNDFDCSSAWLYPGGGATVGAYAMHHDLVTQASQTSFSQPQVIDPFIARRLASTRLGWDMPKSTKEFAAFVIYEQDQSPALPAPTRISALPASALPTSAALSLTTPVSLDGPLIFLGTAVYPDNESLEVETWWQVTKGPITRPFSIMAHLVTSEGKVLGTADGLGVWPMTLLPEDVIVQRHRFPDLPAEVQPWLRTGAYWGDTMERWLVSDAQASDAMFIPLKVE